MQETWVRSLGREDSLEKEVVTHSSILSWENRGVYWAIVHRADVHARPVKLKILHETIHINGILFLSGRARPQCNAVTLSLCVLLALTACSLMNTHSLLRAEPCHVPRRTAGPEQGTWQVTNACETVIEGKTTSQDGHILYF